MTDCHLLLGRLDPENFLGSRMKLDVEAAERALSDRIADHTGLDLEAAAAGVLSIAETNMVFAIRAVTVERGLDPREFVIYSYGGGGGLFAAAVAEELEVPTVVVPRAPANFSAWGILTSDYREDTARRGCSRWTLPRWCSHRGPPPARGRGRRELARTGSATTTSRLCIVSMSAMPDRTTH